MLFPCKIAKDIGESHGDGSIGQDRDDQQRHIQETGNEADNIGDKADPGQQDHALPDLLQLFSIVAVQRIEYIEHHGKGYQEIP